MSLVKCGSDTALSRNVLDSQSITWQKPHPEHKLPQEELLVYGEDLGARRVFVVSHLFSRRHGRTHAADAKTVVFVLRYLLASRAREIDPSSTNGLI